MKTTRTTPTRRAGPARLIAGLRARPAKAKDPLRNKRSLAQAMAALKNRLAETEATLRAIRLGEVDAVVVAGRRGPPQVFTLEGAGHAYRILIESMNEGALTLAADKTVVYANECFARMMGCPLERLIGGSFRRFLTETDRVVFRRLMKTAGPAGAKLQLELQAADGSPRPVQISLRPLPQKGRSRATLGLVVTDMTAARHNEKLLRALTHRVVQVQEIERGRLALRLHDHITQQLCAVLLSSQALKNKLPEPDGPAGREAAVLHQLLEQTAAEVERLSQDLWPSALDHLGLSSVVLDTGRKFTKRTGVTVRLAGVDLSARYPAPIELALYRIFQEALLNVEQHAHARHVRVRLDQIEASVQLTVKDDGRGFPPDRRPARQKTETALGLLGMREHAVHLGGILLVKSLRPTGTEIKARIPVSLGR